MKNNLFLSSTEWVGAGVGDVERSGYADIGKNSQPLPKNPFFGLISTVQNIFLEGLI